jgi:hypothetical protein
MGVKVGRELAIGIHHLKIEMEIGVKLGLPFDPFQWDESRNESAITSFFKGTRRVEIRKRQ